MVVGPHGAFEFELMLKVSDIILFLLSTSIPIKLRLFIKIVLISLIVYFTFSKTMTSLGRPWVRSWMRSRSTPGIIVRVLRISILNKLPFRYTVIVKHSLFVVNRRLRYIEVGSKPCHKLPLKAKLVVWIQLKPLLLEVFDTPIMALQILFCLENRVSNNGLYCRLSILECHFAVWVVEPLNIHQERPKVPLHPSRWH